MKEVNAMSKELKNGELRAIKWQIRYFGHHFCLYVDLLSQCMKVWVIQLKS